MDELQSQRRIDVVSSVQFNGTNNCSPSIRDEHVELETYGERLSDLILQQAQPLLHGERNGTKNGEKNMTRNGATRANLKHMVNADAEILLEDIESMNSDDLTTQL